MTKKYDAFISYSTERADKMAAALEAKLTRYAVPWYKPSKVRIFRDKTALTASALEPAIHRALERSTLLIVLGSPEAVRSAWVNREIAWWLSSKPADRIMLGWTAGELRWTGNDYDYAAPDNAVPPALKGAFTQEQKAVDLRRFRRPARRGNGNPGWTRPSPTSPPASPTLIRA